VDTLQSLVEKSLLRWSGERYAMLETIREFAAEQLGPDAREELLRRLTKYVVALADAGMAALHTAEESAVSAQLAPDYANVRAAVTHALAAGQAEDVAFVLGGLYPFLISHGQLADGRDWASARSPSATRSRRPALRRRSSPAASSPASPATSKRRSRSRRSSSQSPASLGGPAGGRRPTAT
jgi:hypothetical protein